MKQVSILEDTDTIRSGDLVRPLRLSYDGQSDNLLTTNPYGGTRINRLGWMTVDEYMPAWVGKTLKEYYSEKTWHPITPLEILRGELPDGHLEDDLPYPHVSSFNEPTDFKWNQNEGN